VLRGPGRLRQGRPGEREDEEGQPEESQLSITGRARVTTRILVMTRILVSVHVNVNAPRPRGASPVHIIV
jgi:hypothetical protein